MNIPLAHEEHSRTPGCTASGERLLYWDEIEPEVSNRRGGVAGSER